MTTKGQTNNAEHIIHDLLDPNLDTAEIARRHAVDPHQLRAIVRSPAFRTAAAAIHEIDETRTAALLPAHKARAVRRLAIIAAQPAETTAQAESARRAATALIRCKADPIPDIEQLPQPQSSGSNTPNPGSSTNNSGCHADGEAVRMPPPTPTQPNTTTPNPPKPAHQYPKARPPGRPSTTAQLLARAGAPSG